MAKTNVTLFHAYPTWFTMLSKKKIIIIIFLSFFFYQLQISDFVDLKWSQPMLSCSAHLNITAHLVSVEEVQHFFCPY